MSPYASEGSLTTDSREVAVSETWDSQSDWEAYQSKTDIEISNGVVMLAQSSVPPSGIARWTYDDADTESATALDVWNDHDGAISGATTGVSGANQTYSTAEAYDFDGTDDAVEMFNPDTVIGDSSSFSIAFWMNPDQVGYSDPDDPVIVGLSGTPRFYITQSRDLIGLGSEAVQFSDFGFTQGTWTHFIWVYDDSAGEFTVYLDGSLHETQSYTGDGDQPASMIYAGGDGASRYFDGTLDDVRVYSKALSSTEASDLHSSGSIS